MTTPLRGLVASLVDALAEGCAPETSERLSAMLRREIVRPILRDLCRDFFPHIALACALLGTSIILNVIVLAMLVCTGVRR
jgi:hypothetical protein